MSQGELQLFSASLGVSPRSSGGSDPGSFQITASALAPGVCEILCASFKSGTSISHSPLALPKVIHARLQSQIFWGIIFPVQDPWAREPDVGLRPLTPWEEPLQV